MKTVTKIGHGFFKLIERLFFSFYKSTLFFAIILLSMKYIDDLGKLLMSLGLPEILWVGIVLLIILPQFFLLILALRNIALSSLRFINPRMTNECIKLNNEIK